MMVVLTTSPSRHDDVPPLCDDEAKMNYRSLTLTTHLDNDNASTSLDGNELSSSSSSSFYGGIGNIERVDEYLDDNSLGGRDFEFRNGETLAITEADEGDEEVEDLHKIEKCLPFDDDATPGATGRCPTTLPIVPGGGHIDDFPSLHGVTRMKSILKKMDLSCSSGSGHSTESSTSSVSFRSVEVREYDRTVGDNPSCGSGPPVSLILYVRYCLVLILCIHRIPRHFIVIQTPKIAVSGLGLLGGIRRKS